MRIPDLATLRHLTEDYHVKVTKLADLQAKKAPLMARRNATREMADAHLALVHAALRALPYLIDIAEEEQGREARPE